MRRRRQKHLITGLHDLSLTPLIDTALTLLIIFMVATPMMRHAVRITLPKGNSQDTQSKKEEYVIYIDAQNNLSFENKQVTVELLITILKSIIDQSAEKSLTIFIRADTSSSWGKVLEIFDALRSIKGVEHVVLPIQKPTT